MIVYYFKVLVLAVTVALTGMLIWAGSWEDGVSLVLLPLFVAWTAGPIITAYFLTAAKPTNARILIMGSYAVIAAAISAQAYGDAFLTSTSSTASLILIFLPLYQWGALLGASLILLAVEWGLKRRSA